MNDVTIWAFDWSFYAKVMAFVGQGCKADNYRGWLHPGDVRHFLSNTLRGTNPAKHIYVHEANGEIVALVLIDPPRFGGFSVMIHPLWRTPERETELIAWAMERRRDMLLESDHAKDALVTDSFDGDTARESALKALGFVAGEVTLLITSRSLDVPLPEPALPDGFTIQSAAALGMSEDDLADALGKVHSSAFGSNWGERKYLTVMQSPAFDLQNEMVVVAPNGELAAFCVVWIDPVTQSGLFEPVGCAEAYQRRGLTRALMYAGMRRMIAQGCTRAFVAHETEADNPASGALYKSVGFELMWKIREQKKTILSPPPLSPALQAS